MLGKLALAARSSSDKRFLSDISIGLTTAHDTGFISMTVSLKLDYKHQYYVTILLQTCAIISKGVIGIFRKRQLRACEISDCAP